MQVWLRDSSGKLKDVSPKVGDSIRGLKESPEHFRDTDRFSHVPGIGVSCFPGFAVSNRVSSSAQAAEEGTFLSCTALVTSSCCTLVVANASK